MDTQKKTVKEMDVGKKSIVQSQDVLKVPLVHLEKSPPQRFQDTGRGRKGYMEVVNAVINQICIQLRSYLEGARNLSLPKLRKILRFHFHEKSATELYQILVNSRKKTHRLSLSKLLPSVKR